MYSLFHVVNYMTSDEELASFFGAIQRSLSENGVAFLDFWNRAAWLHEVPSARVKEFIGYDMVRLIRCVSPRSIDVVSGLTELEIDNFLSVDGQPRYSLTREIHRMRAYSRYELELAALRAGLRVVASGAWLSDGPLTSNDWSGWISLELDQVGTI